MANNELAIHPDLITLPPRIDPDSLPNWLFSDDIADYQRIAAWYTSFYFYQEWGEHLGMLNSPLAKARALAEALSKALNHVGVLKEQAESAEIEMIEYAKRTNWVALREETVEERMQMIAERHGKGSGSRYEWHGLIEMIPTLEKMGFTQRDLLALPENKSKAKLAYQEIKVILQDNPPNAKETIKEILTEVMDKNITWEKFNNNSRERMGKSPIEPKKIPAALYLAPGAEYIVIRSDPQHTGAIEHALRNMVSFEDVPKDVTRLINDLTKAIMPKQAGVSRMILEPIGAQFLPHSEGVEMPTPGRFEEMALSICTTSAPFIQQLLNENWVARVPVCTLTFPINGDANKALKEAFHFASQKPWDALVQAVTNTYAPPKKLSMIFPNLKAAAVVLGDCPQGLELVLTLEKESSDE